MWLLLQQDIIFHCIYYAILTMTQINQVIFQKFINRNAAFIPPKNNSVKHKKMYNISKKKEEEKKTAQKKQNYAGTFNLFM